MCEFGCEFALSIVLACTPHKGPHPQGVATNSQGLNANKRERLMID